MRFYLYNWIDRQILFLPLRFSVDMAHMLLVTLPLDMIQQGSLHMYQEFCLGMFLVNSLLSNAKYIIMRNEQKNI